MKLMFIFFNLLILNGVAYSKTCDIQEKDLIGYWQVRKQTQSNFEEMEFNIIDNKKIFNSWLHHRPENIEGTWKINNCELVITSGLKYDFKIIKLNNKILEIQENNETYIEKYKKTER